MSGVNTFRARESSVTAEQITAKNVEAVFNLEHQVKNQRTATMRIVDSITAFAGSMVFIWLHVIWFAVWLSFYKLFPDLPQFDPYPYPLLALLVCLEALILSVFIIMSQNRDARIAERRNHLALQLTLLSEQENTKILQMLDSISKKLNIVEGKDPSIEALVEATSAENLSRQIDIGLEKLDKAIEQGES